MQLRPTTSNSRMRYALLAAECAARTALAAATLGGITVAMIALAAWTLADLIRTLSHFYSVNRMAAYVSAGSLPAWVDYARALAYLVPALAVMRIGTPTSMVLALAILAAGQADNLLQRKRRAYGRVFTRA